MSSGVPVCCPTYLLAIAFAARTAAGIGGALIVAAPLRLGKTRS